MHIAGAKRSTPMVLPPPSLLYFDQHKRDNLQCHHLAHFFIFSDYHSGRQESPQGDGIPPCLMYGQILAGKTERGDVVLTFLGMSSGTLRHPFDFYSMYTESLKGYFKASWNSDGEINWEINLIELMAFMSLQWLSWETWITMERGEKVAVLF